MLFTTHCRAATRCVVAMSISIGAIGCAAPTPRTDAAGAISRALSIEDSVAFRSEGDPLDAAVDATEALTSADAVQRAVATSSELQAALARVRTAQAEADQAALLPNPILSFVLRFPEGGGKTQIEAGLGADLLAVLQRPRRATAAGHRLEASVASALSTALDVVANVEERYAEAQALEALVPVLEERLAVLDRLREVAQARLDVGEGIRHDVASLDAERMHLVVEVAERRRELRVARLALARAIGAPSGPATWTLDAWTPPAAVVVNERACIDAALEQRPEVLAIAWELRAREDEEALARGQAYSGASAGIDVQRDGDWSAGPSVASPLPLFDTGRARKERSQALTSEQRHRLNEARRGIVEDVRIALESLAGAQENLARVESELIPLQTRRRAEIDEAYRLGGVDVTALFFAEQALQESRAHRVELERAVTSAHLRLERSVGGPHALRSLGPEQTARP